MPTNVLSSSCLQPTACSSFIQPWGIYATSTATTTTAMWTYPMVNIFDVTGSVYYHGLAYPTSYPVITPPSLPRGSVRLSQPTPALIVDAERAVERSLSLFRRLRPEHELQNFLDGKVLQIRGKKYDYLVKKTDDLVQHATFPHSHHIPYSLTLVRKDGQSLARGCVVLNGAPVIDQVLALILHAEDEEEEMHLLSTTNWSPRVPELALAA